MRLLLPTLGRPASTTSKRLRQMQPHTAPARRAPQPLLGVGTYRAASSRHDGVDLAPQRTVELIQQDRCRALGAQPRPARSRPKRTVDRRFADRPTHANRRTARRARPARQSSARRRPRRRGNAPRLPPPRGGKRSAPRPPRRENGRRRSVPAETLPSGVPAADQKRSADEPSCSRTGHQQRSHRASALGREHHDAHRIAGGHDSDTPARYGATDSAMPANVRCGD